MTLVAAPVLVHDARERSRGTSTTSGERSVSGRQEEFDAAFVARLRAGDDRAFRELVGALHGALTRFARAYSRDETVVEEAVQETWIGVFGGIGAFEGRAPLRTWIFGILVNQARKLAVRAQRQARNERGGPEVSASGAGPGDEADPLEGCFEPDGHWKDFPVTWDRQDPEAVLLTAEAQAVIERAIEEMPESQRRVVLLRDVEGLSSDEVCNILGVTGTHERVLLHRGRVRVRSALDSYLRGAVPAPPAPRRERSRER